MLHTIIDLQEVLSNTTDINENDSFIKQRGNVFFEYKKYQGKYRIERVISTDLKDYLDNIYNISDLL